MSALVIPRRTTPSYRTGYARSAAESANPGLWKGLVGAWVPAMGITGKTLHDHSGKRHDMSLIGDLWEMSPIGPVLDFDGSSATYGTAPFDAIDLPFTLVTWSNPDNADTNEFSVSLNESSSTARQYAIQTQSADDTWSFVVRHDSGFSTLKSVTTFLPGRWDQVVGVAHATNLREIYVNGAYEATNTGSRTHPTIDTFDMGRVGDSSPGYDRSKVGTCYIYDRALSPNEIKHLHIDPLAPLRLSNRVFGYGAAVPPATTTPKLPLLGVG